MHAQCGLDRADREEQQERRGHSPHQRVHLACAALEGADQHEGDEARRCTSYINSELSWSEGCHVVHLTVFDDFDDFEKGLKTSTAHLFEISMVQAIS